MREIRIPGRVGVHHASETARLTVCALCVVVVSTGLALGAAALNPVASGAASGASISIQKTADVTSYSAGTLSPTATR